jgi:hypothetical protein
MIAACYFAVRFREVLFDMQHRVFVGAWQLKQLLPRDAGPPVAAAADSAPDPGAG